MNGNLISCNSNGLKVYNKTKTKYVLISKYKNIKWLYSKYNWNKTKYIILFQRNVYRAKTKHKISQWKPKYKNFLI